MRIAQVIIGAIISAAVVFLLLFTFNDYHKLSHFGE